MVKEPSQQISLEEYEELKSHLGYTSSLAAFCVLVLKNLRRNTLEWVASPRRLNQLFSTNKERIRVSISENTTNQNSDRQRLTAKQLLDTILLHLTGYHPTKIALPCRACLMDKRKKSTNPPSAHCSAHLPDGWGSTCYSPDHRARTRGGPSLFSCRRWQGRQGRAAGLPCHLSSARRCWWNLPWGRPRPLTAASLRWQKKKQPKREPKPEKPLCTLPRLHSKRPRARSSGQSESSASAKMKSPARQKN